jgi:DNA-binding transcriptional LysR family regulator
LLSGQADLAVTPHVPPGFLGEPLMRVALLAVAHPDHPLHHLGRPVSARDLRAHRHLLVRDTGSARDRRAATVEVDQRWTVSHMATSIAAASAGHGFAWLPEERIRTELASGQLAALNLRQGGRRYADLYLAAADGDFVGPGVQCLSGILRASVARECRDAALHGTS